MSKCLKDLSSRSSFTLIELLVVVAIIAILSVFVIITINPAELLKQGRDSQRVSDIATINSALNLYQVDQVTGSLGTASTTYISIPDNTATSTTGTQCQGLSLPALPSGWTYHCPASSTYRNTDGTGWIPVNFSSISYGSPLGSLPVDPTNTSSSGYYYTYTPGGSWQLTATPESGKIRTTQANQTTGAITQGSNLSLSPLFSSNGLVGYWKFDEGSGAVANDTSGGGKNGSFVGSPQWISGKVGNYALSFDGISSYSVVAPDPGISTGNFTFSVWYKGGDLNNERFIQDYTWSTSSVMFGYHFYYCALQFGDGVTSMALTCATLPASPTQWNFYAVSVDRANNLATMYLNGAFNASTTVSNVAGSIDLGSVSFGTGYGSLGWYGLDDIRIYKRALSASEILSLYNATK